MPTVNHQARYQTTFEEFKEAADAINANLKRRSGLGAVPFKKGLIGWVLFVALAVMLFMFMNKPPRAGGSATPASSPPADPMSILIPCIPWLLFFGFIWFFIFRQVRRRYRQVYEQTPALHRPQTITISENGLTFADATAERRLTWDHYVSFTETQNLFLLFTNGYTGDFVPKRIFATPAEVDAFRGLLKRRVNPPTGGFPITPVALPASSASDAHRTMPDEKRSI
jgi:preprotein translocase subunit YajC